MVNEKYAIDVLITELAMILSEGEKEPWYISIVRPAIFGENWDDVKARAALLKMSQVLDGYLKSNNLGKLEIRGSGNK